METVLAFLTSKTFLVFIVLVVVYNMVRRRNRRIQSRSIRAQDRLKDRIRDRQADLWDDERTSADGDAADRKP
jgi:hypothetical protein